MIRLIFLLIVAVLSITGIGSFLAPDDLAGCDLAPSGTDTCQAADAVVAISGGDTTARAEQAIRLYKEGWAPKLVFSGAAQDATGPSNAAAMRTAALGAGVPEAYIIIEENGRTTGQNAENARAVLDPSVRSVIVVTSPYHQRRASIEFGRYFGAEHVRSHPLARDKQWSAWWWTTPGGWYLAIGELVKITILFLGGSRA